ncbi:porin [Paraburkholderia sp. LEh10]|uniref:porin n=1 Tax=Paraburkholderia sp. LEh10 TaxID=2821353 RepID=UPI001AEABA1F|nr:porin [Paraburkholderia sp. LEh10]MBP0589570.1 porin [Paraburkholderia sp. LEh10]
MCTVAQAQSSLTLYGLIDVGVTYANHAATLTGHDSLMRFAEGVAQGNRWGIRGVEDLGQGLRAIFTIESGFSVGNGIILQGGALFGRQAWLGLEATPIGSLTLGRQYTLSRDFIRNYTIAHESPAGNYAYHINDLDQLVTSRINNAVKFTSANVSGFRFGVMYGFSNQAGEFAGSPSSTAGTANGEGSSRTYSIGVNLDNESFGFGIAYTNIRFPASATPPFTATIANVDTGPLRNIKTLGIGIRYVTDMGGVWGNWTHTQLVALVGESSTLNNYEIGGEYAFTPAVASGLGYTLSALSGRWGGRWHQINSFIDYKFSKTTEIYALAVYQKASGSNVIDGQDVPVQAEIGASSAFIGNSGIGANAQLVLRIGLLHKF